MSERERKGQSRQQARPEARSDFIPIDDAHFLRTSQRGETDGHAACTHEALKMTSTYKMGYVRELTERWAIPGASGMSSA